MIRLSALVAVVGVHFNACAAPSEITGVFAFNSDTHVSNSGNGTFFSGNLLTVAQNAGSSISVNYTVPQLGPSSPGTPVFAYSDRSHVWNGFGTSLGQAPDPLNFPSYLQGADYVMTMNGNRNNVPPTPLQIIVQTTGPGRAYLFIDNRLGDGVAQDAPTLTSSLVQWINNDGWTLVNTGLKPADYTGSNDILGIDENNDASIDQYISIFTKPIMNNLFSVYTFGENRNMYGVAFIPEPSSIALCGLGVALAVLLRRRR